MAIRTLLGNAAAKLGKRVVLEIIEPEGRRRGGSSLEAADGLPQ
jgi:hypothetical protein